MLAIVVWKIGNWSRYASCGACGMNIMIRILKIARRQMMNLGP